MKKLLSGLLCVCMLLCGCSKVEEMKVKTAKQVYQSAVEYYSKHVKYFELDLDIESSYTQLVGTAKCNQKNKQYLLEADVSLATFKVGHGYAMITEDNSDFMYATALSKYHSATVDNDMIKKVIAFFQKDNSLDFYSMEGFNVESVEYDDQRNVVVHLSSEDNDYDYIVTIDIKESQFKAGTIEVMDGTTKLVTVQYTFKNINAKNNLEKEWQEVLQLEGTSM